MKKLLISLGMVAATMFSANAQQVDMMQVIENDPDVRVGTLDNGAKYYLRKNSKDPQRANFHIVYDVGAVLEEDRQNGLAHFLEHMAFNGSKNFPDNGLIDYCQSIGVAFGQNLNAGTSQQYTTYMITDVPIVREGIVDSMLLVLHDWAGFITLAEKDIDEERGVITEEWRMGEGNAQRRQFEKATKLLFGEDNIYARRNVIGNEQALKSFTYKDIRDFYQKWYRPDMQAFIIVGDFDVDQMEAKLKAVMANVPAHTEKAAKPKVTVEPNKEPRIGIMTDPELTETSVELVYRLTPPANKYNNLVLAEKTNMLNSLVCTMLNERLSNISKEEGAPFVSASVSFEPYYYPFDMFTLSVSARPNECDKAYTAAYTELLRAVRGGFAEPELERAIASYSAYNEKTFNNRNDRRNGQFTDALSANFLENKPFPSAEKDFELTKALLESTSLEEVNAQIVTLIPNENIVVIASAPIKEGVAIPTIEAIGAVMTSVEASQIDPYTEEVNRRPLLDASKLKGSAVAKTEVGKFESTVWTLKNGVQIVVKPTTLKADEIIFSATKKGGNSTIANLEDLYSINLWSVFENMAGLSDMNSKELGRALAGKSVNISPYLDDINVGFRGQTTIKDVETMLQLTYLYATAPRFDESDWRVMIDQLENTVKGAENDPMRILQDSLAMTLSGNSPRSLPLGEKMLSMVSMERMKNCYNALFGSATDMTFFFTGSIDLNVLKPLVEKYLGSIPAPKSKQKSAIGINIDRVPKGIIENQFSTKQESGRVFAFTFYTGSIDYGMTEKINLDIAGSVLSNVYLKTIREERGGVYVVQNVMQVMKNPLPLFLDQVVFITDVTKVDELLPLVQQGVDQMVADGPSAENLQKAKEDMSKNFHDRNNTNGAWASYIQSWYTWGIDSYSDYAKTLEQTSIQSVKEAAKRAFTQGNRITMVQRP